VGNFENAVWWWSDLYEANIERYHNAMAGETSEGLVWSMAASDEFRPKIEAELNTLKAQDPVRYEAARRAWGIHFDANEHEFQQRFQA
jgi:hypothetical protein